MVKTNGYYGGNVTSKGKPFTNGSILFIKKNAKKMSAKSIANVLHRSVNSVRSKAKSLNIQLS